MRRAEGGLGLRGKKLEFSLGHVKVAVPMRHVSRDVKVDHWTVGVWGLRRGVDRINLGVVCT